MALHYRQNNIFAFHCGYCNAVQAISADKLNQYAVKA